MQATGTLKNYVPIDVSGDFLRESAERLAEEYSTLSIHGLTGDFLKPIELPYADEPRLIAFLGSTIGNLTDDEADVFLHQTIDQMNTGDLFLLGTDLVKDVEVLEAAYNDSRGITAQFNKNILRVINRELDGDFSPDTFRHHAFYNPEERQIEIHLVSKINQHCRVEAINLTVEFEKGESIRTEISCKYTRPRVRKILEQAGLTLLDWYTDPREYFALSVSRLS
ncbi:MAG: Histidine N-alpha-methyltransferase [Candidatus Marinimicrobia bacterium]|nr:Histidine N-alpha-methyltransferase [Candidatus Neomarinimicrobiota bacterium]